VAISRWREAGKDKPSWGGQTSMSTGSMHSDRVVALVNRRTALALTGGLVTALGVGVARGASPAGIVVAVRGESVAETAGNRRRLSLREQIYINDLIVTGEDARIGLRLDGDTTLKLGSSARLRIDRYMGRAGGEFDLSQGAILFDRPKSAPKVEAFFRSLYGLIVVRGTRFFAGPSNDVFGIFVDRGRVLVTAAGRRVTLTAGLGTNIAKPGDPPTSPTRWKAARIAAALGSVE
jgi:ferric-dicitrate binding protein FerR (iron transport regulator)